MLELISGIAGIVCIVLVWDWLDKSQLGKLVQTMVVAILYTAWLSIIPLAMYAVGHSIGKAAHNGAYGTAIFVGVISLTLAPILILPVIQWNYFCHFVWRKVGFKLPLSRRLEGGIYQDWERSR